MKTWTSGVISPPFLTSALDGGELSASQPGRFTPGEWAPDTHWIRARVSPKAGSWEKSRESNTGNLARRYADWAIPALTYKG
jgi:hypothetical protein